MGLPSSRAEDRQGVEDPGALWRVLCAVVAILLAPAAGAQGQAPSLSAPGVPPPVVPENGVVTLSAMFSGELQPIRSGLVWRVFEERSDSTSPKVLMRSDAVSPSFTLPPGAYFVHAAYGFASASKRIVVQSGMTAERLTIGAGALRLGGAIGDTRILPNRLSFSIFVPMGNNSEGRLVLANARAGELVRLPEGTYHVVSTYGESNAIMRSDLKVDVGRITEATLNHRAATMTLKLVATAGGEAFAGTAFSVLTPGGDVIREAIGAFPSVTLAEGDYVLIARHEGQVYTREFKVESGLDRDVEVLVKAS
jgi:hypothetical protein